MSQFDRIFSGVGLLLDCLFPVRCTACHEPLANGPLCERCRAFLRLDGPACHRCGAPTSQPIAECGQCRRLAKSVFQARSHFRLTDEASRFWHLVKFGRWHEQLRHIENILEDVAVPFSGLPPDAALVPVPLSKRSLLNRGFNQSGNLAEILSKQWNIPIIERGLIKPRDTPPQSTLGKTARARNLAGAFEWDPIYQCGHTVVLVDDVFTTGATLSEGANTLAKAGCSVVYGWTLFRAL